jgi:hypothetical protein
VLKVNHKVMIPDDLVFLPYMYCEEPTKTVVQSPAMILRCLKTRGGIVAVLGRNIWTATKATSNTAIRVINAMMRPLLH